MLGGCAAGGGTNVLACTTGKDADVVPMHDSHDDNSYVRQLRGDDDSEDDMPLNDGKGVDDDSYARQLLDDLHLNADKTPFDEPPAAHDTALVVDADQDSCSPLALQSEAAEATEAEEKINSGGSTISHKSTPSLASDKSGKTSSSQQEDKPTELTETCVAKQPSESGEVKDIAVRMTNEDAKAAYDKICSFVNIRGSSPSDDEHEKNTREADPPATLAHIIVNEGALDNIESVHPDENARVQDESVQDEKTEPADLSIHNNGAGANAHSSNATASSKSSFSISKLRLAKKKSRIRLLSNSLGNIEKDEDCLRDVRLVEEADNIEVLYGSPELVLVSDADADADADANIEPDAQVVDIATKLSRVGSKQSTQTDGTENLTLDTNDETKTRTTTSNSLQETVVQVSSRGTGFLESLFSCGVPCIDKKEPTLAVNEMRDVAEDIKVEIVQPSTDKINDATVQGIEDEVNPEVQETTEEPKVVTESPDELPPQVKDNEAEMVQSKEVSAKPGFEDMPDGKVASTASLKVVNIAKKRKDKRMKQKMNGVRTRVFKQLIKTKKERKQEEEALNELEIQHVRVVA